MGVGADQQRQRGIQSAGNSDHGFSGMGMFNSLGEAGCLNAENFPAAFVHLSAVVRNKRVFVVMAVQTVRRAYKADRREFNGLEFRESAHGGRALSQIMILGPLEAQTLKVDFTVIRRALSGEALAFFQDDTVFRNDTVAAEDHIRRGFGHPRGGVYIAAVALGAFHGNEISPVIGFSDRVVAGGRIKDNVRPV